MIRASIAVLSMLAATAATAADDPNNRELAWWRLVNQVMDDPMAVHFESCILDTGCYISANDRKTMLITFKEPKARLKCPFVEGKSVDCLNFDTGRTVRLHKDRVDGHWSFPKGLGLR